MSAPNPSKTPKPKSSTVSSSEAVASALELARDLRGESRELPPDTAVSFVRGVRESDGPQHASVPVRAAADAVETEAAERLARWDANPGREDSKVKRGDPSTLAYLRRMHGFMLEKVEELYAAHAKQVEQERTDPRLSDLGKRERVERLEAALAQEVEKEIASRESYMNEFLEERVTNLRAVLSPPASEKPKVDPMVASVDTLTRALQRAEVLAATRDMDDPSWRRFATEVITDPMHPLADVVAEAAAVKYVASPELLHALVAHARNASSAAGAGHLLGDEGKLRAAVELSMLADLRSRLAAEVATLRKSPGSAPSFRSNWEKRST